MVTDLTVVDYTYFITVIASSSNPSVIIVTTTISFVAIVRINKHFMD